jgi:hypothetical protein
MARTAPCCPSSRQPVSPAWATGLARTALDEVVAARVGVSGATTTALVAAERALVQEGAPWGCALAPTAARAGEGWAAWAGAAAALGAQTGCEEGEHTFDACGAVTDARYPLVDAARAEEQHGQPAA